MHGVGVGSVGCCITSWAEFASCNFLPPQSVHGNKDVVDTCEDADPVEPIIGPRPAAPVNDCAHVPCHDGNKPLEFAHEVCAGLAATIFAEVLERVAESDVAIREAANDPVLQSVTALAARIRPREKDVPNLLPIRVC